MDPLIALLIVVTIVLTVLLVVVGVHVVLILRQARETFTHLNSTLKNTDQLIHAVSQPFEGMGNMVHGVKSGLKIAEIFVKWLKENQIQHDKNTSSDR
jgi:predicted PurR-regulated permease PerM